MGRQIVELKVNGEAYEVAIESHRTLLEVLRENLGLTGAKESCDLGDCGFCTVIMDGKAVLSCLVLALDARGKDILTVEGLAKNGELHPVQKAFVEHGAVQCGFCTPGMIMSAKSLLDRNASPTEYDVRKGISGHQCRCTGYVKIVEAILAASEIK